MVLKVLAVISEKTKQLGFVGPRSGAANLNCDTDDSYNTARLRRNWAMADLGNLCYKICVYAKPLAVTVVYSWASRGGIKKFKISSGLVLLSCCPQLTIGWVNYVENEFR
jgi:hypothetical protein